MNKSPRLAIICPCFNEEEILLFSLKKIDKYLTHLIRENVVSENSFILLIDDGSTDKTWELINSAIKVAKSKVKGIKLSRNFGHQNAVFCGIDFVKKNTDISISIDVDLQDDINAIKRMITDYQNGSEVVHGVRQNRTSDTWFKRSSAGLFYSLLNTFGLKLVPHAADFRLLSRKAMTQLSQVKDVDLFLRRLVPKIGFRQSCVYYDREERLIGESKYPFKKMLSLALKAITSLTTAPLRLITYFGLLSLILSLSYGIYIAYSLFTNNTIHGWASLALLILVFGGLQMVALGIIGEYIGKLYEHSKNRPLYIIESLSELD